MTQKANPWTFDVRVRDRNLKAGSVTDKDVEKYLGGLPDLADQSESFATSQPALLQPVVEVQTHSTAASGLDDGADEDEDEDEDDDVDGDGADGGASEGGGDGASEGGGAGEGGGDDGSSDPSSPE